jgi:ribonuclease BN (tRNA processing enzyme)
MVSEKMKLKVLGTGTSIPSLERCSSAYLLSCGDNLLLIDAGPAVVRRLLEYGYSVDMIDVVILTHFHVDHSADLSTFLFACNYGMIPREKPLLLIGGPGMHRFYRGLLAIYPWLAPKSYKLTVKSLPKGSLETGGLLIESVGMNHNPESIGVRISHNSSVTFSGDTGYTRKLGKLARHTDLLVTECAYPEKKAKGHMNLAALRRVVEEAKPRRVILSHLYPDWNVFGGIFHAPYILGVDGLEVEL